MTPTTTASVSNSLVLPRNPVAAVQLQPSPGSLRKGVPIAVSTKLSFVLSNHGRLRLTTSRSSLTVRAASDDGRPSNASIFVGGFVLGGIIAGTLGCVYAPQISKALAGTDRKDLMRKLPKFIYDEEKALEKTRKILTEKIAQLNSAIDDVSAQLRSDDSANGVAVNDEIEAAM